MNKEMKVTVGKVVRSTLGRYGWRTAGILLTVAGAVIAALLPPLVLENLINRLSLGEGEGVGGALLYFGLIALTGFLESLREVQLTVFGQRITRNLRQALSEKQTRLTAQALTEQEPGEVVSGFIGDVDTVEELFTSGVISMAADFCKVISILVIIRTKNPGLALVLLLVMPVMYAFTRLVQKQSLKAQIANRRAVGRVTAHVPETIENIRTIHVLEKEAYMEKRYREDIEGCYKAMEKTNFFDSVYSPVILILNAAVIAAVMVLSAAGVPGIRSFFGMSVGTAVAVISYISQVFGPLESIGMEIQTIQSAAAGVHRINEFLRQPERWDTDSETRFQSHGPCLELKNLCFGYVPEQEILHELSFQIMRGEHVTLAGRTGAGKTTVFKLLTGQYRPQKGSVLIFGQEAALIPDSARRRLIGYVEQSFHPVPGTFADQIRLFDESVTMDMAEAAAKTVGIHDTIAALAEGYATVYEPELLSQGQQQLLSIARAVAARPEILLLDEITANLDGETEREVLKALQKAAENRTVLSISHRLYEETGGRRIEI